MLNTFETSLGQTVKMTELYDFLELSKSQYSRFVKKELIDSYYFESRKDYSTIMTSNTILGQKGQHRQEIDVHIDCAKKICMISKSKKGNEIREYLVQLTKKVENASLISHDQVMQIVKLIKIFSIYEYRKLALEKTQNNYLQNAAILTPNKPEKYLYAEFHNWRNEALNLGSEYLAERVKEYCLLERKRIPNKYTKDEAITMMGEYEQIKNSFWDLLSSQNKSEEMINNVCSLAQYLSKEMKPYLERFNLSNLFFQKLDVDETNKLLSNFIA